MDIPLDDPTANKAAAKIQAGFRGHMTRKKMKDDKPREEVSKNTLNKVVFTLFKLTNKPLGLSPRDLSHLCFSCCFSEWNFSWLIKDLAVTIWTNFLNATFYQEHRYVVLQKHLLMF